MGTWDNLKGFFSSSEPLNARFDDPFIQIDRAAASEKLKLKERGEEQGKLNLPPSTMDAFDNVESEIVAHIAEHYSRAQIDAANNARTYDSRLGSLALLSSISSIRAEASKASGDFKAEVGNALNRLSNSRDAITNSYDELRQFKADTGIRRPAHPASPAVATYGAIFMSWVLESGMNTFLLKQNDSMGLLGGAVAAATVGAINILGSAFVGRQLWPRTNLRDPVKRGLAWAGVAVWLVLMVAWNLLAAYFRDAKSAGLPNPEQAALEMFGQGLSSIYSWGLLIAGIIFAFSAAIAAYKMDDPYPGYGSVTRRHNQRCEEYAEEVADSTEELKGIRDEAIGGATDVRRELERQLGERSQIETARASFMKRFEEFTTQIELIGNSLLQEYRAANMAARTEPAPSHFSDKWRIARIDFPTPPRLDVSAAEIKAAEKSLDLAIVDITTQFDAAIERFEPLDVLKRRLSDG